MSKSKKIISVLMATLALSAFAGCGEKKYEGEQLTAGYVSDVTQAPVSSNGGFAVEKGEYVYFVNGSEVSSANNSYGKVVKGALMRISKTQLAEGKYSEAQILVPSLFVAGDYTSGIYIYGDYVYYATPTTDKNNDGQIENSYLDFKRAKLDGTEAPEKYFLRLSSNSAKYRFVEVDGAVYCMYEEDSKLKSYNVETKKTTVLVSGASGFFYDTQNVENPNVYYTMGVTYEADKTTPTTATYNQIYCVNAAATAVVDEKTASYKVYEGETEIASYNFDEKFMKDNAKDKGYTLSDYTTYPYVNLGKLVLDGVGKQPAVSADTRFNKDETSISSASTVNGYTYTIQSQTNDGLYFTRKESDADPYASYLYYLPSARSADWNTVTGNKSVDIVSNESTNASATALFLVETNGTTRTHSFLHLSETILKRTTTNASGAVAESVNLAYELPTELTLWKTEGDYLYYYGAGTNGKNLTRINYKGAAEKYNPLYVEEEYEPLTVSLVDFNDSWYKPEFIKAGDSSLVLYSSAQSFGATAYSYIYAAKLGATADIVASNEKIDEVNEYIDGYEDNSQLQDLMRYYFRSGETAAYEAVKAEYSTYQQEEFDKFVKLFADGGKFKGMMESDFIGLVGRRTESDDEAIAESWADGLLKADEEEDDSEGLPAWAIVLIVVGSVLVVGAGVAIPTVIVLKKKKAQKRREEAIVSAYKRKKLDTTDDKSIDVYADEPTETVAEEATEAVEEQEAEESSEE